VEEQGKSILDAKVCIEAFKKIAIEYINQGAEVLVPACGTLSLAFRFSPGCPELPNGLTEFDGVPIVDDAAIAIKMAEIMVDLKRAGSSWISRKGIYSRPSEQFIIEANRKIGYSFGGVN
jgi:hypothetical protein